MSLASRYIIITSTNYIKESLFRIISIICLWVQNSFCNNSNNSIIKIVILEHFQFKCSCSWHTGIGWIVWPNYFSLTIKLGDNWYLWSSWKSSSILSSNVYWPFRINSDRTRSDSVCVHCSRILTLCIIVIPHVSFMQINAIEGKPAVSCRGLFSIEHVNKVIAQGGLGRCIVPLNRNSSCAGHAVHKDVEGSHRCPVTCASDVDVVVRHRLYSCISTSGSIPHPLPKDKDKGIGLCGDFFISKFGKFYRCYFIEFIFGLWRKHSIILWRALIHCKGLKRLKWIQVICITQLILHHTNEPNPFSSGCITSYFVWCCRLLSAATNDNHTAVVSVHSSGFCGTIVNGRVCILVDPPIPSSGPVREGWIAACLGVAINQYI